MSKISTDSLGNTFDDSDTSDLPDRYWAANTEWTKYKGNYKSAGEWADYFKVSYAYWRKENKKMSRYDLIKRLEQTHRYVPSPQELEQFGPAEAHGITKRGRKPQLIQYKDTTKTIKGWADHFNMSHSYINNKLKFYSPEQLFPKLEAGADIAPAPDPNAPETYVSQAHEAIDQIMGNTSTKEPLKTMEERTYQGQKNLQTALNAGFENIAQYLDAKAREKGYVNYNDYRNAKRRARRQNEAAYDALAIEILSTAVELGPHSGARPRDLLTPNQHGNLVKLGRTYAKHFAHRLELGMQPSRAYQEVMELYREHKREGAA